MSMVIRDMRMDDCQKISEAFKLQGWNKPEALYQQYFIDIQQRKRDVIIAERNNEFAGYVTILWTSDYPSFRENNIPEIVDLNVLIKYRNRGIATLLIKEAESRIFRISDVAGIGVGLTPDYGLAQKLYVQQGYIPDGKGVWAKGRYLNYGTEIMIDDDVVLYFTKKVGDI
ncbi:MAG: GNAT family N-acetyltransferase [Firmicutes bacterium HGW-Firmicutes-10]|nr:MAG: GNAT family N-acetyltransferase [Firmicutes bacterium HGW-Firmicutes-10]